MSGAGWVKLHRGAAEHPALASFDEMGVWAKLLMLAAREPRTVRIGGQAMRLERAQVAVSLCAFADEGGITRKRMRNMLGRFRASGMLDWGQAKGHAATIITICNFDAYQSTASIQGQPNGQAAAAEGPSRGQGGANEGPTIEEERKGEVKKIPPAASRRPPRKREGAEARGCRLPEDFGPSITEAKRLGLTAEQARFEAEKFRDHWRAASGRLARRCDWPATWRNWCRNAGKVPTRSAAAPGASVPAVDPRKAARAEAMRQLDDEGFDRWAENYGRILTDRTEEILSGRDAAPLPRTH